MSALLSNRPRLPVALSSVAAGLLAGLLVCGAAVAQRGPSPVDVVPVRRDNVATSARFVGTVEPVKRAIVGSAVDGRVEKLLVNEGDRVGSGDDAVLAQVLTSTIELEKQAAEAELRLRKEELGELEAGTRPEEKRRAKAALDYAETNFERAERLYRNGTATVDVFESARSAFETAKAEWELVEAGPRKEAIAQAKARFDLQQAMVDKLADQIKKYTVRSRFPGFVVAEHTEEGAWVKSGDPVAEVAYLDEVHVRVYVLESQVQHVRKGQTVRVDVPAIPTQVTGQVVHIVPQANTQTRTFPITVEVENTIEQDVPLLKAGMLARVFLPTGEKAESLLVPKDALVLGGPAPIVYVATPGDSADQATVRPVPVSIGGADGSWIAVEGELAKGDLVVVRGNERIRPGQTVKPRTIDVPTAEEPAPTETK